MGDMLYAIGIILVVLALMYYSYGMMAATVLRWSKKPKVNKKGKKYQPKLTVGETLKCYIPYYQVCVVRKALYRSNGPFAVLSIISAAFIFIRIINLFIGINSMVMFITVWMMYIGLLLHIIIYGFVTADAVKLYGFGWLTIIISFFVPYFIGFHMKALIPSKMLEMQKEETFAEHKADVRIRQRNSK